MAAHDGRDPGPERQGLDRAHPVAQARGAGDLPAGAPVPGAQGLAERPPHRTAGGIVRLDRAALGDRQPPAGPDPVRPGTAPAGRDRAVAAAGTAGRHGHPRPPAARAGRGTRCPGRHPGRGRLARPPVGGDRGRGHPGLPGAPVRRHLLLADLPRAVQTDRPAAQHGLAALAGAAAVLRRRRAGDRRCRPDVPARPGAVRGGPAGRRLRRVRPDGRAGPAGEPRCDLHPVAVRRAHAGRGPVRAGRFPQPVAVGQPG